MSLAVRSRCAVALWVCVPFVALGVLDGAWKSALLDGPHLRFWIYDFTKWVLLPIVLMGVLHRFSSISPRDYGLSADLGSKDLFYVLPLPLASLFFANLLAESIANIAMGWPKPLFTHHEVLAPLGKLWILGTLYLSTTAAVWESIFLIGLPWFWYGSGTSGSTARRQAFAVGSALVFAACHWENGMPNAIGAFFFQWLAVWWYLRLRTLWPVIGAHFLIDVYYFWPPTKL
jgi:Type II CAAX prenyl endopeptidase Rce1-like